jgi:hypothetical protein
MRTLKGITSKKSITDKTIRSIKNAVYYCQCSRGNKIAMAKKPKGFNEMLFEKRWEAATGKSLERLQVRVLAESGGKKKIVLNLYLPAQ